jgi:VCBS repeat-containing protein
MITNQEASIPAGNPPSYGQVSVSARAITPGARGNIRALDINQVCCAPSVLVKNLTPFQGGQDARNFPIVATRDIESIAIPLKRAVAQSMQAALLGQLLPPEQLQLFPCTPTITSNHSVGQEATIVKVIVSQTCSGFAYNRETLQEKVRALLSAKARKIRTGYSLLGDVQVKVTQVTVNHKTPHLVFLVFQASGTWAYAFNRAEQTRITRLMAGKTTQAALLLIESLPGVTHASIHFAGMIDETRVPKSAYIHFVLLTP